MSNSILSLLVEEREQLGHRSTEFPVALKEWLAVLGTQNVLWSKAVRETYSHAQAVSDDPTEPVARTDASDAVAAPGCGRG